MPLPVIAISNASTCLTDAQVEAVLPALQKQASDDFKAYWELDCTLTFLNNGQPLTRGWWQIVITDNPDQAGALGYHEMTTTGTSYARCKSAGVSTSATGPCAMIRPCCISASRSA